MLKILQDRCQQYMNWELPDVQAGFRRGRGTRHQIANIHPLDHRKSKRVTEKHLPLLYWLGQSLWLCGSQQTGKFFKRWEYQTTWPACLLRNLYAGQEATVITGHGTTDWFQIGKGVCQGYCHSAYLIYMQRTSSEMLGWLKHKLESRFQGELPITSDLQMAPPLCQKVKRN